VPLIPIASVDDPRLADYRDIATGRLRERRDVFAVESREVVRRLLMAGRFRLRSLLATHGALAALADVLPAEVPVYLAARSVVRDVVGFNFHRGCMGIAERGSPLALDTLLETAPRLLIVGERLSNPDNVGGIFRNGMAFGADGVVLSPGSGDPLYRKVVRVSIGAAVTVPFVEATAWPEALAQLRAGGCHLVALATRSDIGLDELSVPSRIALLVGNEGEGLSETALDHADVRVRIPMAPGVDSLNAVVACGIALHALTRKR
jgi:tRNA G18 (ribose-2'-O)-methylase SpoU